MLARLLPCARFFHWPSWWYVSMSPLLMFTSFYGLSLLTRVTGTSDSLGGAQRRYSEHLRLARPRVRCWALNQRVW